MKIVQYLVENGANVHAGDHSSFWSPSDYPIKMSSTYGHLAVVQYLIEQGCDAKLAVEWGDEKVKGWAEKYINTISLSEKITQDMSRSDVPPISKKAQELIDSMRGHVGSTVVKQEPKHRMKI